MKILLYLVLCLFTSITMAGMDQPWLDEDNFTSYGSGGASLAGLFVFALFIKIVEDKGGIFSFFKGIGFIATLYIQGISIILCSIPFAVIFKMIGLWPFVSYVLSLGLGGATSIKIISIFNSNKNNS